jgi:hypothetical protein
MIFDGMGEMGDKVPAELEPVSKFVAAEVTRRNVRDFGEIRLLTSAATLKIEF